MSCAGLTHTLAQGDERLPHTAVISQAPSHPVIKPMSMIVACEDQFALCSAMVLLALERQASQL
eukprot:4569964-Amphidinium_carterae.2